MTILQQLTQRLEKLEDYEKKLTLPKDGYFLITSAVVEIDDEPYEMSDCANDVRHAVLQIVQKKIYNVKQEISSILFPPRDEAEQSKNE